MTEAATARIGSGAQSVRPAFVYRHVVTFEDTNAVGNVYYTGHIAWQGRCRELFLAERTPGVLAMLGRTLHLVTLRVECEYYEELRAFDALEVQMRLAHVRQHRIGLDFDYLLVKAEDSVLAARGFQEVGCMRPVDGGLVPTPPPQEWLDALAAFAAPVGG